MKDLVEKFGDLIESIPSLARWAVDKERFCRRVRNA